MSGWTVTGSCPRCGAPIYSDAIWHGITPPPIKYSCDCASNMQKTTTTDSTWRLTYNPPPDLINEVISLRKEVQKLKRIIYDEGDSHK